MAQEHYYKRAGQYFQLGSGVIYVRKNEESNWILRRGTFVGLKGDPADGAPTYIIEVETPTGIEIVYADYIFSSYKEAQKCFEELFELSVKNQEEK